MAPRRKTNLSRRSRHAEQERRRLSNMTEEERISVRERNRLATDLVRYQRNGCERVRIAGTRTQRTADLNLQYHRLAFRYNPAIDYSSSRNVVIGQMSHVCTYCQALKFNNETKGMCCAGGKIKFPHLEAPPEPLKTLLAGSTAESKHFLSNIRKYNSCFQMTSFGAEIVTAQFMPTFKIKGQIYHKAGSLLPFKDSDHKFLQMYFIGDDKDEIDARYGIHTSLRRSIISQLQELLHERNNLVQFFKIAIDMMPSDTHKIVIHADKTPVGEHVRRYNAPTINEVAIVMVGDQFQPRDIVLHRRNDQLINVGETHRCYDALQYPIIFWDGADGYHFNVKMVNPVNGAEINKKCSAMNFYTYRLMIRRNEDNYIMKYRQLFHQ
ncbi:ATP-dependent DNA helicase [Trichonephila clavipes]|nr:ATP-dependent DNA helicase [Trichonephila clavipes]